MRFLKKLWHGWSRIIHSDRVFLVYAAIEFLIALANFNIWWFTGSFVFGAWPGWLFAIFGLFFVWLYFHERRSA